QPGRGRGGAPGVRRDRTAGPARRQWQLRVRSQPLRLLRGSRRQGAADVPREPDGRQHRERPAKVVASRRHVHRTGLMTGLRSRQKLARREAMLAAASQLFDRQGYARTTFEQIAAASNMGVATVYKYFGSKEGVVKALLTPDLERILENGQRIIARPPLDPARAVILLLKQYGELGGHHWARRDLLRMTIFPGLGNQGVLASFVVDADTRVKAQ